MDALLTWLGKLGLERYGAVLADTPGHLFLCKPQSFNQFQICPAFLDRIQLLPLNVLDKSKLQEFVVGYVPDDCRYPTQLGSLRGPPSALTRHDLVSIAGASYNNRLYNAILADGPCEFVQLRIIKAGAGLLRIWFN